MSFPIRGNGVHEIANEMWGRDDRRRCQRSAMMRRHRGRLCSAKRIVILSKRAFLGGDVPRLLATPGFVRNGHGDHSIY